MIERERQKTLFSYFLAFWGTLIISGWEMMWIGQKDFFRAGWNRIFLFLVLFKNRWHLVSPGSHLFLFGVNQRNEETARAQDFPSVRPQGWKDCPQIFRELLRSIYLFHYLFFLFINSFIWYFYLFIDSFILLFIHFFIYVIIYLFSYFYIQILNTTKKLLAMQKVISIRIQVH